MQSYTNVQQPAMFVAGISCKTANTPEAAPQDIPKLWGKFYAENVADKILNKSSDDVIALYCEYEGDYTKPYTVIIGYPVSSLDDLSEGIVGKVVPAGCYARFVASGEHPKAIIEKWGEIWQTPLDRTYTGDYELYGKAFTSQNPQEVEVFVAVKPFEARAFIDDVSEVKKK